MTALLVIFMALVFFGMVVVLKRWSELSEL